MSPEVPASPNQPAPLFAMDFNDSGVQHRLEIWQGDDQENDSPLVAVHRKDAEGKVLPPHIVSRTIQEVDQLLAEYTVDGPGPNFFASLQALLHGPQV